MQYKIYRFLAYVLTPLVPAYLIYRKYKNKRELPNLRERFGHASIARPEGGLVWLHAASVGEAISVIPLINEITKEYPTINLLVTTGTVTSAKVLNARLPSKVLHQFVPVDVPSAVVRFLKHWKPDIAFWVESELWPNLIIETYKTGCKMIQINARISEKSYKKWKQRESLSNRMLSCFSLSLAQTHEDLSRLIDLGARNAKYAGNLKFDAPALPAHPHELGKVIKAIGDRPVWVAASTHRGEEDKIIDAHIKLKGKHKNLLTIIIPRHPARGAEIADMIPDDVTYAQRSKGADIEKNIGIYIADTIGELGIFYRIAGIVFMGGSIVEHGGQNPLEPARLECAIVTGTHIWNFTKVYDELTKADAIIRIANSSELTIQLDRLFSNNKLREGYAKRALALMEKKRGALAQYMKELEPYLKPHIAVEK